MPVTGLFKKGYLVRYSDSEYSLERDRFSYRASGGDRFHTVKETEDLLGISYRYYGTTELWSFISEANNLFEEVFDLPVGLSLVIPDKDVI